MISSIVKYIHLVNTVLFKSESVKKLPVHLQVEITTFCNLNCVMCVRRKIIKEPKHMTMERFKTVFDQIGPSNVNLSGLGEPLLNPDIFDMAAYCHENEAVTLFPTNLAVSKDIMSNIIDTQIDQLKISIDAVTPETYNHIRRKDCFDQVVKNIKEINRLKKERRVNNPELRFNFALQSFNVEEISDIFDFADNNDVRTIYFQWLLYDGIQEERKRLTEKLTRQTLRRFLRTAKECSKRTGIKTNIHFWERDLDILYARMIPDAYQNKRTCLFPWISTYITVDGDVYICPKFANTNEGKMGNVFEKGFSLIWNSPKYQHVRKSFNKHKTDFKTCEQCIPLTLLDVSNVFNRLIKGRL